MEGWNSHTNRELTFKAPSKSTSGLTVVENIGERDSMQRVHVLTDDGHEVYFETLSFPAYIEHKKELESHKRSIEQRFEGVQATDIGPTEFSAFPASTFRFESADISRTFIVFDTLVRTYRVVYDHESSLNEKILSSLMLDESTRA